MPGLLDDMKERLQNPANQGLLNLGLNMMANSGYSAQPRSFGEIFGASALPATQAYKKAQEAQDMRKRRQNARGLLLGDEEAGTAGLLDEAPAGQRATAELALAYDDPRLMAQSLGTGSGGGRLVKASDGRWRRSDTGELAFPDVTPTENQTSTMREYQMLQGMTPEQRAEFFRLKRGGFKAGDVQYDATGQPIISADTIARTQAQIRGETEAEKIRAKDRAQAQVDLPAAEINADYMLNLIDRAKDHPGLSGSVGVKNPGTLVPGTPEADFKALYDQITGGVFMQAYQSLKGGGQITEIESKKAEEALARLSRAQSEEAFKSALDEFASETQRLRELARQRASGGQSAPQSSQYPPVDDILKQYGVE